MPARLQRWAILVGAGYNEKTYNQTISGSYDVERFKDWLIKNRPGMSNANIKCLTTTKPEGTPVRSIWPKSSDEKIDRQPDWPIEEPAAWASKVNIIKELKNRLDNSSKDDLVFFYFIGHGMPGGKLVDCHGEHIPASDLTSLFEEMAKKGLILTVIMGSCYSGGAQRTDTILYPYLGSEPEYNLLTAASPYQTANAGGVHGFDSARVIEGYGSHFTSYLLNALNENPQATLKMLHRRAFASNSLNQFKTLPILRERNKDNCSFFDTTPIGALQSIAAKWTGETTVEIDAGKAHGIRVGSKYDVYRWDADKILPNQVKVEVTKVNALTSEAVTEIITRACQVVLTDPIIPNENMNQRWGEYYRMLNLKNYALPKTESYLPQIFSFGVYDGTNTYDVYNRAAGTNLSLRFQMQKHPEYKFVRLTVLQFMANGDIHKYYPWAMDFEVITPDSECVFEIEKYMDDESIGRAGPDRATVTFKAMITIAPTSFETVLGARIRDGVTGNRSRDGEYGENRVNTLPAAVTARRYGTFRNLKDGEGGDELNPPGRWRTISVTIHTSNNGCT